MSSQGHLSNAVQEVPMPVLERHPGRKEYPLSLNQQHMWFQIQLDLDSTLWNLAAKMDVTGSIDIATFIQALQNTVDRHDILRTVFVVSDDVPMQRIINGLKVECPVIDLPSGLSAEELETKVWAELSNIADRVYDLTTGPLFRTGLLRANDDKYYFIFAFHHLLLDAFYSGQFMKEVATAYDLLRRQQPLPEAPKLQFGDFCAWQQERWTHGHMNDTIQFWHEQLQEPLPEVNLQADALVPLPRIVKSHVTFNLDKEVVQKLRDVARQARTTLFRVMLASFTLFFSRMSESGELIVDIDFSTRPREMGRSIGFFANLLPVRFKVFSDETFIELLQAVDQQLRNVSANREFPVRQLTRKLKNRRNAMQPLSPIVVTQLGELNWSVGELHLAGSIYVTASIHDVWLGVLERNDDLDVILAYPEKVFTVKRAFEWSGSIKRILECVSTHPDLPISQLILPEDQDGAVEQVEKAKAAGASSWG